MAVNGKETTFKEVDEKFKTLTNKNTPIDIRIDKKVPYERVVIILDLLKKYNLPNLSLITKANN